MWMLGISNTYKIEIKLQSVLMSYNKLDNCDLSKNVETYQSTFFNVLAKTDTKNKTFCKIYNISRPFLT